MNPPAFKLESLFEAAIALDSAEARASYLDRECPDPQMRREVEGLLAAHDNPDTVFTAKTIRLELPSSEAIGTVIGRYKLLEALGEGGFGSVWLAEQREPVRRKIALKIIKLGMDTKQIVARFEAERQALALMDHPNIAKVIDAGSTDTGRPYFVMELVRGIPITRFCDENKLATHERLDLFIKVCHAIQHAHQKGIIHRDVKPSNVLVTLHDGVPVPKVIDFGVAKATQQELTDQTIHTQFHQFVGTPAYVSPEQAEMSGLDIDTRSDIYSLGVLLYELLAGSTPFDARELMASGLDAMRKTIREIEPPRPSTRLAALGADQLTTTAKRRSVETSKLANLLRGDLDWIVMKCLEKDRQQRYETANGLAADLKRHLDNEPVIARPPSQLYRFQKMVRRNKTVTLAAACIVVALTIGLGLAMTALVRERAAKQRELAQSVRADTVATFINALLSDTVPVMIRQGNVRGARELVDTADRLASSSLSNAPAAEINLRLRLRSVFNNRFFDTAASLRQAEMIERLLPRVSDDQLSIPREELLLYPPVARLWAASGRTADEEQALKELKTLSGEFIGRKPPEKKLAMMGQYYLGQWHMVYRRWDQAEEAFATAYELRSGNLAAGNWTYKLPAYYANTLSALGKPAQAEVVVRENLKLPHSADLDAREGYLLLIDSLNDALCRQDRFADATRMLEEQRRLLAERGASEADLLRVDALRGAVPARSSHAREALPILDKLATDPLSDVLVWHSAVWLAVAAGDEDSYRRLCRLGVLRFASTAEGLVAVRVADGLLARTNDAVTLALARGLVERVAEAQDYSKELSPLFNAILAWRERRNADALGIMDRSLGETQLATLGPTTEKHLGIRTRCWFIRAMLFAELGRVEEARRSFAQGCEHLRLSPGDQPGQDRGADWLATYAGETLREEVAATFKAKGIPLPEPPAK